MNKKEKLKIEKKIYECLGVNIFRKGFLFSYEKVMKFFKINVGYRLDSMSIEGLENYKMRAKGFAIAHILVALLVISLGIISLTTPVKYCDFGGFLFNLLLNGYCIMVQRYNVIRINELEEKIKYYQYKKFIRNIHKNLEKYKANNKHVSKKTNNNKIIETIEEENSINNISSINKVRSLKKVS